MKIDILEKIDNESMKYYGHTNWAVLDELSWQERLQKKYEVRTFFNKKIAFFTTA